MARASLLITALAGAACAHLERGGVVAPPAPDTPVPRIRVGLVVGQPSAEIGGGAALLLTSPDGSVLGRIPAGVRATASQLGAEVALRMGTATPVSAEAIVISPEDTGSVRVGGREYRGHLDLIVAAGGLVVANRLTIEDYLAGVVSAEMGRRSPGELTALLAQAVVSRTVALRALGRAPERGFDVLGTVADQAYLGVAGEQPQGIEAVAATRGIVLMHAGTIIDAFYHSTCGGRTAEPTEIFAGGGGRPYLRSMPDQDRGGRDYCAISPRYRWREEWTGAALLATLRETLRGGAQLAGLAGVEVRQRGPTGRVMAITVTHGAANTGVDGANAVRQVLRPPAGGLLLSSDFTLRVEQSGAGLERLVAEGRGAGHGVGMCQWGAVGRARAGAGWEEILAAYFPGAEASRLY